MKTDFILLLGANQFQRERALIGAEKVFDGAVVTVSPLAPFQVSKYSANTLNSEETNPKVLLNDVINFCDAKKMNLRAVVPLNDFVLNAGLVVAEYFRLPYNSEKTISSCRTKDVMKSILMKAGLPVVASSRFATLIEADEIANKIGYPLVIKPVNFGGSGGVIKVEHKANLAEAISKTQAHLNNFASKYDSDPINMLMEPYITIKREISVEVINTPKFRKVIGITDKFLGQEPHFSEIAHLVPSTFMIDESLTKRIESIAIKACEALDIKYGMAHVEMKVSPGGEIIIIEVGARTAGDGILDLYEKATGFNLYGIHCKALLNSLTEAMLPRKFIKSAAIGYIHPASGTIESINPESLSTYDLLNVDLICIKSQVGQNVLPPRDWSTRYGFIEFTIQNDEEACGEFDPVSMTKSITDKLFKIRTEA